MTSGKDVARPFDVSLDESPETLDFTAAVNPSRSADPMMARREVFADRDTPEVFRSVCHRHEIWRDDPYDVATIHAAARQEFERLMTRTSGTNPESNAGRILLILGESGAGKTHLMRVFRNHVHSSKTGYCGYLQMTSATDDYSRYVLSNIIDSLDQPYCEGESTLSGLMSLSNALVEIPSSVLRRERESLREDRFSDRDLAKFIQQIADLIIEDERYSRCDVHLIQALIYLQREEPRIKSRVLSYLRCEALSDHDREILGGMVPRTDVDRTIEALGQLMWSLQKMSLVVCVDQLEDMANLDRDAERFRRAMTTVCSLAERVPSSVFVISCLEDLYPPLQQSLTRSYVDRIEHDPEPIRLESRRSGEEILGLVGKRLAHLYACDQVPFDEQIPTDPIPVHQLDALVNTRTRDILDWCRDYRRAVFTGVIQPGEEFQPEPVEISPAQSVVTPEPTMSASDLETSVVGLTQLWNDALAAHNEPTTDDDDQLARQLAEAVERCGAELPTPTQFQSSVDGWLVRIENADLPPLLIGLCNKSPQGGALSRQVGTVQKLAGDAVPILVRSTEFPDNPRTKIAKQIGQILDAGGRQIVVEDSDWRAMQAMRTFEQVHANDPGYAEWLKVERPLTRLKSLRSVLPLDQLAQASASPQTEQVRRAA
ncbi:hypothetical protein [Thalassoroseus pseudoceratinae]|uniref:hypothetical protein n=1 Tax=Thalassoroseus pseudoceratinae TaxID=2713176 RepID=UPI0014234850|nr:hypothetical protein [Thalassoroseus pseudoceratinae]